MIITINGHEFSWPSLEINIILHEDGDFDKDYVVHCARCHKGIDNPRASDVQKACEGKCVYCSDDCEREDGLERAERSEDDFQSHKAL